MVNERVGRIGVDDGAVARESGQLEFQQRSRRRDLREQRSHSAQNRRSRNAVEQRRGDEHDAAKPGGIALRAADRQQAAHAGAQQKQRQPRMRRGDARPHRERIIDEPIEVDERGASRRPPVTAVIVGIRRNAALRQGVDGRGVTSGVLAKAVQQQHGGPRVGWNARIRP